MRTLGRHPDHHVANGEISWDSYLGPACAGPTGSRRTPHRRAPTDLTGLPPALVTAYELDALRDEDIAYAQRLLVGRRADRAARLSGRVPCLHLALEVGICQTCSATSSTDCGAGCVPRR